MKVSALMTANPVTVPLDASLEDALAVMDTQDFRHLPVMRGDHLIGVVSERDLLENLGRMPGESVSKAPDILASERPRTVGEIVHVNVRTVSPAEYIDVAAAVFVGLKIGCLPVVDDGRLLGIVTEMDLLAAFELMCRKGRLEGAADPMVSTRMSTEVIASTVDTSLQDAFSICFSRGIRHLPVLDGDIVAGLVSDRDLRAAANSAHPERIRLADIMASQLEVVEPEARLSQAARQMVEQKVTTLPVMQGDQLLGMLSLSDVLSHCVTALREV